MSNDVPSENANFYIIFGGKSMKLCTFRLLYNCFLSSPPEESKCEWMILTEYQRWIANTINMIDFRLELRPPVLVARIPGDCKWCIRYEIRTHNIQFDAFIK